MTEKKTDLLNVIGIIHKSKGLFHLSL